MCNFPKIYYYTVCNFPRGEILYLQQKNCFTLINLHENLHELHKDLHELHKDFHADHENLYANVLNIISLYIKIV